MIFDRLATIAPNEEAKKLAQEYIEKGNAGVQHFLKTQDQGKTLLAILQPQDFQTQKALQAAGKGRASVAQSERRTLAQPLTNGRLRCKHHPTLAVINK